MRIKTIALAPFFCLIFAGCGTTVPTIKLKDMSEQEIKQTNSVLIYNQAQLAGKRFQVIDIVEGISCRNKSWDPSATRTDAIFQAKYWAFKKNANGITNIQCGQPIGVSSYNCWESITCSAEAIRID